VRVRNILFFSFTIAVVSLLLFSANTGIATAQPLMQGSHTPLAESGTATW